MAKQETRPLNAKFTIAIDQDKRLVAVWFHPIAGTLLMDAAGARGLAKELSEVADELEVGKKNA